MDFVLFPPWTFNPVQDGFYAIRMHGFLLKTSHKNTTFITFSFFFWGGGGGG